MPKIFPDSLPQNPFPVQEKGQEYTKTLSNQVLFIMEEFKSLLSDAYKSQTNGPSYMLQFQAVAEEIAKIQISAQEVFQDSDYDFTRSEFLYRTIGALIFPPGRTSEIPSIDGDITYRTFLKKMVSLLLSGATKGTLEEGFLALTDSDVTIIEKSLWSNTPGSAWGFDDQFSFEVNVSTNGGTSFPSIDPFVLKKNMDLVLRALKPAHTVYDYRHLFIDSFAVADDTGSETISDWMLLSAFKYDDARNYCGGIKNISSSNGLVLSNRKMLRDTSVSFDNIQENATLSISSGVNKGQFRVTDILVFPTSDTIQAPYTTYPTGLSGTLSIFSDYIEDLSQDFSTIEEGELISIISGLNSGVYRVKEFLGLYGGPIHVTPSGPVQSVRLSKCILYLDRKMSASIVPQVYTVSVDRLGVKEVRLVTGEDVSSQFYL